MKKTVALLALSVLCVIPAGAQYWGPYAGHSAAPSMESFSRRILNKLSKVEWVSRVRSEERRCQPGGYTQSSYYTFHTTDFKPLPLHNKYRNDYNNHWRQLFPFVKQNHTLGKYEFVVVHPIDLAILNKADIEYLISFLKQPAEENRFDKAYTPYSVKQVEKGVTEIKLRSHGHTFILRVDSFRKKAFFFLNEY